MKQTIAIIGLGYVGLPLAVAFAKHYEVIGFDISEKRIQQLQQRSDETKAVSAAELESATITFTSDPTQLRQAQYIIIAVPTPVDEAKHPDLNPLKAASVIVGKYMTKGVTIIYESTVYPGVTEEICLPILEKESGMRLSSGDFSLGYSPERINPGDEKHRLDNVVKIVSGNNHETLEKVAALYEKIVKAGVYKAPSIKVAEAAKIVENVQRDINIAFINEIALIFDKLNIDTKEVLDAAGTKWNFHKYFPGLVGGHCIGVDPYYLAFQAAEHGYHPKIILSGREVNDYMARHVADLCLKELTKAGKVLNQCTVVLLGLTFKENVTDLRNTRAGDVIGFLQKFGITVVACEPNVESRAVEEKFGVKNVSLEDISLCDAVIFINRHDQFSSVTLDFLKTKLRTPILIDVKRAFSKQEAEANGFVYRAL